MDRPRPGAALSNHRRLWWACSACGDAAGNVQPGPVPRPHPQRSEVQTASSETEGQINMKRIATDAPPLMRGHAMGCRLC